MTIQHCGEGNKVPGLGEGPMEATNIAWLPGKGGVAVTSGAYWKTQAAWPVKRLPRLGEGPLKAMHFSRTAWRSATTLGSLERPRPLRQRSSAGEASLSQRSDMPARPTMKPATLSRTFTVDAYTVLPVHRRCHFSRLSVSHA